ncbi:hypothetical protein TrST_g9932 [Triparma strigata]|uniref:Adenylate kinase n=1 Tax=Triparma strigata TaxID=1606541 RepID=A0A9W7ACX0_9STRA|nr:hypothetical protein TrST_g9932 [Triparma strigata]
MPPRLTGPQRKSTKSLTGDGQDSARMSIGSVWKAPAAPAASSSPPKIIIAGAPASGKGTQCEIIKARYNVVHLSTGDMLRAAVAAGSEVGKKAKAQMEAGELVSDEVIIGVVKERLAQQDCRERGWLLDGFPRTRAQADALASAGITCDSFVFLKIPDEILVERVVGRRTDPETGKIYHLKFSPPPTEEIERRLTHRADDTEEKVKVRLKAFHENVNSISSCYTAVMFEVKGDQHKKNVEEIIVGHLDTLFKRNQETVDANPPSPPPPPLAPLSQNGDKAVVLKLWSAMGGDEEALTYGSDDMEDWKGITVRGGRVTKIAWQESKPPLSGVISKEIGKLSELTYLGLWKNVLSGEIPKEIGNCKKLEQCFLNGNKLNGAIPKEIGNFLFNYRFRDNGHRFREIERIEEIPAVKQMAVRGETAAERVKVLLAKANWKETEFQKRMMNEIVDPMNQASSIRDLCETYGIDSSSYVYDKFGNTVELIDPIFAFGDGTASNVLVKERFGPPKGYQRALAKEEEGITKSGADKWIGLRDLNRVTFEFEDPLMLTLACNALMKKFKVSGLKNKFENVHVETYDQPPDIHMNLDLGKGWLVEVQLMFASVLTIKKELHKFYDIVRAKEPSTILSPLFDKTKTNEGRVKEELKRTKKALESNKEMDVQNQNFASMNVDDGGNGGENKRLREENEEMRKEVKRLKTFIREKMVPVLEEAKMVLEE